MALSLLLLHLFLLSSLCSASAVVKLPQWSHEMTFRSSDFSRCFVAENDRDSEPIFLVCWTIHTSQDSITFGVGAVTQLKAGIDQYVGFGVTEGGMFGADLATFSPKLGLQDRYSRAKERPTVDPLDQQDVTLLRERYIEIDSGTQGVISFVFSRPLRACDGHQLHDMDITRGVMNLIWAIGDITAGGDIAYHSRKGMFFLDLFEDAEAPSHFQFGANEFPTKHDVIMSQSTPSLSEVSVTMSDVAGSNEPFPLKNAALIEGSNDSWMCIVKEVHFPGKVHIVEIDPIVTNATYVYHLQVYRCTQKPEFTGPLSCQNNISVCTTHLFVLPIPFSAYRFPSGVGLPIGENGVEYLLLEIHYKFRTPPNEAVDASGLRLRYTNPLPIEAGAFFFYIFPKETHVIPGRTPPGKNTTFSAYLLTDCLGDSIPNSGLTIFDGFFHMHQLGSSARVHHFRNYTSLPLLAERRVYNSNFQYYQPIAGATLKRGDVLKLSCVYDTRAVDGVVHGGRSTTNEMCFFYFLYYNRMALGSMYTVNSFVKCGRRTMAPPLWIVERENIVTENRTQCPTGHVNVRNG